MTSVGVRELRQRASELLRLVAQGKTIEVTDRGRPVAFLTPVPAGHELARLRAAGETTRATGTVASLPPPLRVRGPRGRASAVLARLRADER